MRAAGSVRVEGESHPTRRLLSVTALHLRYELAWRRNGLLMCRLSWPARAGMLPWPDGYYL